MRWFAAFVAASAIVIGLTAPAGAWQVPSAAPTTSGTLGTPSASATLTLPNGITETITGGAGTGTAQTAVTGSTTLGSRGFVATDYTAPALATTTPAVSVQTNLTNNCPASGTCSGLGSFTITFSSPVTDPVLALGGLCGNVYGPSGTPTAQSEICDVLTLTSAGATLSKISGANLAVTGGNTITATNPNAGTQCNTVTNTNSLPALATAACGAVQVLGTVSSLTFSVSGTFTPVDTTGVIPGDSCNTTTSCTGPPTTNPVGVVNQDSFSIVAVAPNLSLSLAKTASPSLITAAGQTISYSFVVTNTGDLTMSNIAVNESAFSGTGTPPVASCPSSSLAAGASETCTATYTVTQADVDGGKITNTATAWGTPPHSTTPVESPPSSTTVTANAFGKLGLVKTAVPVDTNGNHSIDQGDEIHWTFVVSNLGDLTITDIAVSDPTAGAVSCPATSLAPGESMTCTAPAHVITAADAVAGHVLNVATASGHGPGGHVVSSTPARATVEVSTLTVAVPVAVPPAPQSQPPLAFTGTQSARAAVFGLGLLIVGALMLIGGLGRRRKS
jgi:uncharacterized repeat protein (TIGR01451 family)